MSGALAERRPDTAPSSAPEAALHGRVMALREGLERGLIGSAGLVERLLGFLDIGKDFVTAETIVQVKDLARKYPDIAEVCVGSVSNISLEVSLFCNPLGL